MSRRRRGRLYRGRGTRRRELREFDRRYGARGQRSRSGMSGAQIYGATIGKVRREQAERAGGELREYVRPHEARSDRGRRFRVRGHYVEVHAHPHGRGDHPGHCDKACRRGLRAHRHPRRRYRR